MSKIILNGQKVIEGEFSFSVSYDESVNPPILQIVGTLSSKAGYLPEITSLENDRYVISGITVKTEHYGSEEDTMLYDFEAKAYGIANNLREVKIVG